MRSEMARLGRKAACITASGGAALRGFALRAPCLILALATACTAPHTLITARHTPCKPKQIQISHFTATGFGEDWYASCDGNWYRCSTREQGHRLIYRCRSAAAPPGAADAEVGARPANPVDAGSSPAHAAPPQVGSATRASS